MRSAAEIIAALSDANAAQVARDTGINQNHLYKIKGSASRGLKYDEGVALAKALWPVDEGAQQARTTAIEDILLAAKALLQIAKIEPALAGAILAALPAIAQAAQSAREAGHDAPSAVFAIAQHMIAPARPATLPQ